MTINQTAKCVHHNCHKSLPVQDLGEVSMTKADYDTDDDYIGFNDTSSGESSRPVNNTNKNELEVRV